MTLSLTITGQEGSKLKLAWRDDEEEFNPAPYCVGHQIVLEASRQVREVLNRITAHYQTCAEPSYTGFLPELSQRGIELSDALFDVIDIGQEAANEVKEHLARMRDRVRLTVYSDAAAHVPWNFVFGGREPIKNSGAKGTIEDFSDFWSARFGITTRFTKSSLLKDAARNRANFRVLYILHRDAFQKARSQLTPRERECMDRLIQQGAGNVTDWTSARQKWRSIEVNDSVLYIFGHSNGQAIALADGDDQTLTAGAFRSCFKKTSPNNSATICFTNGCWTAAGNLDQSFLTATSQPGFYGFIGSEAEVSNEFATRYGLEFMQHLCERGHSVQHTFDHLRKALFPLSLLYSCFAHGKFRVEPCESPGSQSNAA